MPAADPSVFLHCLGSGTGNWLSVSPATGPAGGPALTVSVDSGGLAAGTYSGSILITPAGGTRITVPVSLTVATAPRHLR